MTTTLELDQILVIAESPQTSPETLETLVTGLLMVEKPGPTEHWILVALARNTAITDDMRIRLYGRYYGDVVFRCLITQRGRMTPAFTAYTDAFVPEEVMEQVA